MSNFSLDVLQDYFDDLLTPEALLAEPEVESLRVSAVVEDLARQNLARLLASKPVEVVADIQPDNISSACVPDLLPILLSIPAPISTPIPAAPVRVETLHPAPVLNEQRDEQDHVEQESVEQDNIEQESAAGLEDDGWLENGRPSWAQQRFDVLLFEVAGLTLAVPLISLGQIQPLTDELTPLFGQADWFVGLQPTPVGRVRTINTARFVMPERYEDHFIDAARYVISIANSPWGLAVDAVNQPITLNPEDVKWRGERSKRPWLAGTVKQHMCALLDIPTMGRLLQQTEQTQSKVDPLRC